MCKIREYVVEKIDKHNISELYRSIVTTTMQEYVVGILNEWVIKLEKEIDDIERRLDECNLIDERYFVKCDLYDLKEELGRINRICTLVKGIKLSDNDVA